VNEWGLPVQQSIFLCSLQLLQKYVRKKFINILDEQNSKMIQTIFRCQLKPIF